MTARRIFLAAAAVAVMTMLGQGSVAQAATPEEQDAINAAEKWLVPVDAGKSADGWAMAAASFKARVSRQEWVDGVRALRKPYGKLVSRKPEKLAHVNALPGAPAGEYVTILFEANYAGGKKAAEEVMVVRESDGVWRVAGYFIR